MRLVTAAVSINTVAECPSRIASMYGRPPRTVIGTEMEVASPSQRLSGPLRTLVMCDDAKGGVVTRTGGASRGGTIGGGEGRGVGVVLAAGVGEDEAPAVCVGEGAGPVVARACEGRSPPIETTVKTTIVVSASFTFCPRNPERSN